MMRADAPNSERFRARYISVPPASVHRGTTPRWTLGLLAISVAFGIAGGTTGAAPLSMALLIVSCLGAAGALAVYLVETRRPRLGGRRRY